MDKDVWGYIDGIGNIYVEEELVVGTETILFTCEDDIHNKYLFMTYDSYEGEYVFIKLEKNVLINMLEKRIPIEKVYRDAGTIYMTHGENYMNLEKEEYEAKEFPPQKLPEKNVYYTITSEYIKAYIDKLKTGICSDTTYEPLNSHVGREIVVNDINYKVEELQKEYNCNYMKNDKIQVDNSLIYDELAYAA